MFSTLIIILLFMLLIIILCYCLLIKTLDLYPDFNDSSIYGDTTLWLVSEEPIITGAKIYLHCRQCNIKEVMILHDVYNSMIYIYIYVCVYRWLIIFVLIMIMMMIVVGMIMIMMGISI